MLLPEIQISVQYECRVGEIAIVDTGSVDRVHPDSVVFCS